MGAINQSQLLEYINALSLAQYDTALFLDTHPCDTDAQMYYDKVNSMLNQARKEYSARFTPLTRDEVTAKNGWDWINHPWPWEGGCK